MYSFTVGGLNGFPEVLLDIAEPWTNFQKFRGMLKPCTIGNLENLKFAKNLFRSAVANIVKCWEFENGAASVPLSELYSSQLVPASREIFARKGRCPFESATIARFFTDSERRTDILDVAEMKLALASYMTGSLTLLNNVPWHHTSTNPQPHSPPSTPPGNPDSLSTWTSSSSPKGSFQSHQMKCMK